MKILFCLKKQLYCTVLYVLSENKQIMGICLVTTVCDISMARDISMACDISMTRYISMARDISMSRDISMARYISIGTVNRLCVYQTVYN